MTKQKIIEFLQRNKNCLNPNVIGGILQNFQEGDNLDLSYITASADKIAEGYIGSDTNGEPVNGALKLPEGSLDIIANGNYDVELKKSVVVNVPNPSTGTLSITENGTANVKNYEFVSVDVQNGLVLDNGYYNVQEGAAEPLDLIEDGYYQYTSGGLIIANNVVDLSTLDNHYYYFISGGLNIAYNVVDLSTLNQGIYECSNDNNGDRKLTELSLENNHYYQYVNGYLNLLSAVVNLNDLQPQAYYFNPGNSGGLEEANNVVDLSTLSYDYYYYLSCSGLNATDTVVDLDTLSYDQYYHLSNSGALEEADNVVDLSTLDISINETRTYNDSGRTYTLTRTA